MVSDDTGLGVTWALSPPVDGACRRVAVSAGQTLIIDCGEAMGVLLVRHANDLDVDFGVAGSIRLVNGVEAATMQPAPRIAGRDGGSLPLDRVINALTATGLVGSTDGPASPPAADLVVIPFLSGVAVPALLDRTGLHLGVPEVDGVQSSIASALEDGAEGQTPHDQAWALLPDDWPPLDAPDAAVPDTRMPPDGVRQDAEAGVTIVKPGPEFDDAAGQSGMVYGDTALHGHSADRVRRVAQFRRLRRRLPEPTDEDGP